MKPKGLVSVIDAGENSTVLEVQPVVVCLRIQKDQVDSYRRNARKILDQLSESFNAYGINSMMAALLYENLGEGYDGKNNK